MNLKTLSMMGALLLLAGTGANAQKKKEEIAKRKAQNA